VRPSGGAHYGSFTKSICAGAAHLIRKVFSSNFLTVLSRFRASVTDEPILAAIFGHMEVIRVLNHCGARALTARLPNYANKYVVEYLAKTFNKKCRREILKFHHQYLAEHLADSFYEELLQSRAVLWTQMIDGHRYAISMSFDSQWHSEGDISLTFDRDDVSLYTVAFSIVPGHLFNNEAKQVLFVARVQGRPWQSEAIGIATRACDRIAPPHLLLAATQAIATTLSIGKICGVTNAVQLAKFQHFSPQFRFDYDAFWKTFLVTGKSDIAYEIPVPFHEKPATAAAYRSKARLRRRQFKKQVAECVGATFAGKFLKGGHSHPRHTT
jgi:uncharacterized protein VirK/YbjX